MKKKLLFGLILLLGILSCVVFVGCKSPEVLPTPQNLKFEARLLSWDKVEGAIGYTVFVNEQEYETADTSFAVVDITAGNYTLGVMAIGDGDKYTNSKVESIPYELLPAPQHGVDEIGFYYKLLEDGTGWELYRGTSSALNQPHLVGDIKLPTVVGDYPVKRIAEKAFHEYQMGFNPIRGIYCNTVTTGIEFPKYLESIGQNAFYGCISLREVSISSAVVIGPGAFYLCKSLKKVTLPNNLKEIDDMAFYNTALDSIELPQTLEVIGEEAFMIEDREYSYTEISGDIFDGGTIKDIIETLHVESQLSSLVIPASVKSIGAQAFSGRKNLRDITILSTNLEFFNNNVFADTAWEQAQPDGLIYLREDILYGYKGEMPTDTTLTIASGVKYIAGGAFCKCSNLKKIVLPDGVKLVGESTFSSCTALEEVVLPKDLPNVSESTFINCTSLKDISFFWEVFDGDYLGMRFAYCTAIEEVTIPTGIKTLNGTFSNCTGLKKVTLPEGIETLDQAFRGCTSLKEITLPSTLKVINDETFTSTGLVNIILPKSLEKIGNSPFRLCKDLKSIYYEGTFDEFKGICFNYDRFLQTQPVGSTVYYYSESEPTTVGNYWHYVDGQAVAWQTTTETTALQQEATQYTFVKIPAVVKEEN